MRLPFKIYPHIGRIIKKMADLKEKSQSHPFTVIVEGNIGSGKTTFLNYFKKKKDICVLAEPIEMWRDCDGNNLLGLLYEDPKRWSFSFQLYVLLTMMQNHTLQTEHSIKLMERSVYSGRYCFIEKMTKEGFIPAPSATVIDEYFNWILNNTNVNVDLIVYLRTTPETVYNRMIERNRQEEKAVSFKYISELHEIHEKWLYHKTLYSCPAPVLVLDANLDKKNIITEYTKSESHIYERLAVSA
ncbi:dnk [Trypoxylus dichotomus]